jgi:hypothetical protein
MALSLIAEIMGWSDDQAQALRMMSEVKYDGYSYFRAGIRFIETLATWLKQFASTDRAKAYNFVKQRLVYISPHEMQCLVETLVPEIVIPNVRKIVANELGTKAYEVWKDKQGAEAFNLRLRKTLFVGMSDGSRIDMLRRVNAGRISTEQIVPMLNVDDEKWRDLSEKLSSEKGMNPGEKFDSVYLIDDFTASGTTFIRIVDGKWKGKLKKFNDLVCNARAALREQFPIEEGYVLHIHHYVSSHQAHCKLIERLSEAVEAWTEKSFSQFAVTHSLILPETMPLSRPNDDAMLDLGERYYDHALFKRLEKHCAQAGQSTMKLGYANCALPVVLEHNTPNNSVPLLWAETRGTDGAHAMRPLFYRRDRHG